MIQLKNFNLGNTLLFGNVPDGTGLRIGKGDIEKYIAQDGYLILKFQDETYVGPLVVNKLTIKDDESIMEVIKGYIASRTDALPPKVLELVDGF